ncbi:hypothetical protein [Methanospirillum lacunae]|uniref:hypothetical protein n=1 Tax=Methanospirillum lacunae TaxID=668570 RepID=UPI0011B1D9BF|nr:hypothetical protein [Methanospirillum lacunae]
MCYPGSNAGTFCEDGGSASGAFGRCTPGSAATGMCVDGNFATASFCDTGSGKGLCSNGNDQVSYGNS